MRPLARSQHYLNQVIHTPAIPALEMSRQEDQELKVILAMQRIQSQLGIQETLSQGRGEMERERE